VSPNFANRWQKQPASTMAAERQKRPAGAEAVFSFDLAVTAD
jgi:hypothetical protein